jgi:hypothetical protein
MNAIMLMEYLNEKCHTTKVSFALLKFTLKAQAQILTTIVYILDLVTSGLVKCMHITQNQGLLQEGCYKVKGKFK